MTIRYLKKDESKGALHLSDAYMVLNPNFNY